MKVSVIDLSGFALGLSIGLKELGHQVDYYPGEDPGKRKNLLDELKLELVRAVFGTRTTVDPGSDLVIICDSFTDFKWALEKGIQMDAPYDPADPFVPSINPLVYRERLKRLLELGERAGTLAVIDGSDKVYPREEAFLDLGNARLFAREVPIESAGGRWIPFPYIYNFVILLLERTRQREQWFIPFERRRYKWDWVFCGTVGHARYQGKRVRLLEEVKARWPGARFHVPREGTPFVEILEILQSSLWGLDLPGGGELCFRMHEYLSLGIPILRPWPWTRMTIPEMAEITGPDPFGPRPPGGRILKIYEECFAPKAAAERLLSVVFNL